MSILTIYGDAISGNCLKVRWAAQYLGVPYEWRAVSVRDGETRRPEFLALNQAGQVPFVLLEADDKAASAAGARNSLAQSNAIIFYLAARAGNSLIPETVYAQAKMYEWLFWEQYSHEPAIAVRRYHYGVLGRPADAIDPSLLDKGHAALAVLETALDGQDYLLADGLSLADLALLAYTRVADEGGFDLGRFPAVTSWIGRVSDAFSIDPAEGRLH